MKIGILGGGQLARMLALAGYPLGLRFAVFEPDRGAPAAHLADHYRGPFRSSRALSRFAKNVDVVTYEFENVPVESARRLAHLRPVYPPPEALEAAQDRLNEKTLFRELRIPVPPFAAVVTQAELVSALDVIGLPAVLKTRRLGYDGKGQVLLRKRSDVANAFALLGNVPSLVEAFVPFEREVSILAVRGRSGETRFYPLVENRHAGGILRVSRVPAHVPASFEAAARRYAKRVLEGLNYVGVLAIEFFVTADGLMANEMAPRVHNSGHWTIEGAETSQFENHLRAIAGLPLGSARAPRPCAMLNLIGAIPPAAEVLACEEAHLHLYDKEPRPGRKVGHVTVVADTERRLAAALRRLSPKIESR